MCANVVSWGRDRIGEAEALLFACVNLRLQRATRVVSETFFGNDIFLMSKVQNVFCILFLTSFFLNS